jgi:phosphate/sulfate permease
MATVIACTTGIYDCSYREIPECAVYNESYEDMEGKLWIVILSGFIMCAMAFGMGANDAGKIKLFQPD